MIAFACALLIQTVSFIPYMYYPLRPNPTWASMWVQPLQLREVSYPLTHHENSVDGGDLEGHWVTVRHARYIVVGGAQVVANLGVVVQPLQTKLRLVLSAANTNTHKHMATLHADCLRHTQTKDDGEDNDDDDCGDAAGSGCC